MVEVEGKENMSTDITSSPAWGRLTGLPKPGHLRELFDGDPDRGRRFVLDLAGLRVDFAKQRIDDDILAALIDVAASAGVESRRDAMFAGEHINTTEDRPVLHVALRAPAGTTITADGTDV
ncbi:MAG: glucose-6-phosphate isomerase, partial [Actinomycetota bacterium]|nr:glucose-6-phosphate isomerase [Actinomycetota bacterium]